MYYFDNELNGQNEKDLVFGIQKIME